MEFIPTSITKKHFQSFDALRFCSFLFVFLHHLPYSEGSFISYFSKSGGIGVTFFFVLSGFLITYILLTEKIAQGYISLKNFLMRRILRIWPLFYVMIAFAFATPYLLSFLHLSASNEGYEPNWFMSVLFLENYKMMSTHSFPNVSPLRVMWSLCVEEHFYIIWGIAISLLSIKKIPYLIFFSIVIAHVFKIVYHSFGIDPLDVFSNIDYFAFGAIPAYVLVCKRECLLKIEALSLYIKYALTLFVVLLVFALPNLQYNWLTYISPFVYGMLFSMVLFFIICPLNSILISDRYWISKLGVLTYGLYVYHTIIINLIMQLKKYVLFDVTWLWIASLSLISVVLISFLSYHLFEKQFLKLKKYFY